MNLVLTINLRIPSHLPHLRLEQPPLPAQIRLRLPLHLAQVLAGACDAAVDLQAREAQVVCLARGVLAALGDADVPPADLRGTRNRNDKIDLI